MSSIIDVERFYMEEDMKGREREKFPLSLNIMSHAPHTSIIELNLVSVGTKYSFILSLRHYVNMHLVSIFDGG